MNKISLLLVLFCTCIFTSFSSLKASQDSKLNIATFNIRLQTSVDAGARSWTNRKQQVAKLIHKYHFDVLGVQEVGNKNQEADLKKLLPEYNYFGKGRDNQAGTEGEQVGIFYNANRFVLKDKGSFFLSETPDNISFGWDAVCRRMCVWARLYDVQSQTTFYVFCSHFDHKGVKARVESAKLIINKMKQTVGTLPVFFIGDLNTSPDTTDMYTILCSGLNDSREIAQNKMEESVGTFNGFDVSKKLFPLSERIDYIFCNKINVFTYHVLNDKFSTKTYPSDHFAVMIECELNNKNY